VVNDELTVLAEELGEGFPAMRAFEEVLLLYVLPGQLAPLPAELIAQPRELLFLRQEALARGDPLIVAHDRMVGHVSLHRLFPA
jgi:hypothetical protein